MTLAVEMGDGFTDDDVVVLIDGQDVWRRTGVTTNYSVGIAAMARVDAAAGATVEVRARGKSRSYRVGPETHLRADIAPGGELHLGPAPTGDIM
jgi:hypothetical protein